MHTLMTVSIVYFNSEGAGRVSGNRLNCRVYDRRIVVQIPSATRDVRVYLPSDRFRPATVLTHPLHNRLGRLFSLGQSGRMWSWTLTSTNRWSCISSSSYGFMQWAGTK